jgi:BirA family transcriptional regulator, biotin operon repressor / biotin---[acetyl-CoA-carboxylase] ligase
MSFTLIEFDELPSTSDYLKENHQSLQHLTFVKANYQTQGRGQFDRTWESEKNLNLLCSVLFKPLSQDHIQEIKNKVLHALIHLLETYGVHARYKAPNDLYVDQKKICGILIETQMHGDNVLYAVAGIGLNINQVNFEAPHATSLAKITQRSYDISKIFQQLVSHITSVL